MLAADIYRAKAAQFLADAQAQTNPGLIAALENLARSYLRLADQADKNAIADIAYESGS